jgi:hypothetical protein
LPRRGFLPVAICRLPVAATRSLPFAVSPLPTAHCLLPFVTYDHKSLIFNIIINKYRLTFLKLTGLCILRSNYNSLIRILYILQP